MAVLTPSHGRTSMNPPRPMLPPRMVAPERDANRPPRHRPRCSPTLKQRQEDVDGVRLSAAHCAELTLRPCPGRSAGCSAVRGVERPEHEAGCPPRQDGAPPTGRCRVVPHPIPSAASKAGGRRSLEGGWLTAWNTAPLLSAEDDRSLNPRSAARRCWRGSTLSGGAAPRPGVDDSRRYNPRYKYSRRESGGCHEGNGGCRRESGGCHEGNGGWRQYSANAANTAANAARYNGRAYNGRA
jgi:hypothetical protein